MNEAVINTHTHTHDDTHRRSGDDRTLTGSGFGRAITAKVDSPSHTHAVLESRTTDLQPRADQEPSRDALRAHTQELDPLSNKPRAHTLSSRAALPDSLTHTPDHSTVMLSDIQDPGAQKGSFF